MFDTDKFIECVRDRPALWEKTIPEYSDKYIREHAWSDVGMAMYEDWTCFPLAERDEKVKEMKKKWRHIRDHFVRTIGPGKNDGPAASKKKKYVYSDALSFLISYENKRPTSENIEEDEDHVQDEAIDDPVERVPAVEAIIEVDPPPALLNRNKGNRQKKLLDSSHKYSSLEEDVDRMFLLSMLDDYRASSESQKVDFKMMNLQFFKNIKDRQPPQEYYQPPGSNYYQPLVAVPPLHPMQTSCLTNEDPSADDESNSILEPTVQITDLEGENRILPPSSNYDDSEKPPENTRDKNQINAPDALLKSLQERKEERERCMEIIGRFLKQPEEKKEDENDHFFKSMVMTVKRFSPPEQAEAKFNIMKVVHEIEMRHFSTANTASTCNTDNVK